MHDIVDDCVFVSRATALSMKAVKGKQNQAKLPKADAAAKKQAAQLKQTIQPPKVKSSRFSAEDILAAALEIAGDEISCDLEGISAKQLLLYNALVGVFQVTS